MELTIIHIHAKRPEDRDISLKKYMQMLELLWKRLSIAGYVNEFEPNTNNIAWATYTTKEITALDGLNRWHSSTFRILCQEG